MPPAARRIEHVPQAAFRPADDEAAAGGGRRPYQPQAVAPHPPRAVLGPVPVPASAPALHRIPVLQARHAPAPVGMVLRAAAPPAAPVAPLQRQLQPGSQGAHGTVQRAPPAQYAPHQLHQPRHFTPQPPPPGIRPRPRQVVQHGQQQQHGAVATASLPQVPHNPLAARLDATQSGRRSQRHGDPGSAGVVASRRRPASLYI